MVPFENGKLALYVCPCWHFKYCISLDKFSVQTTSDLKNPAENVFWLKKFKNDTFIALTSTGFEL